MTKGKKILISAVAIFCALAVGVGTFLGITLQKENQVSFTVSDTLEDGQGKKATVILLGGQSNASGCSRDEYLQKHVSAEQYDQYQNGYDNVYINYFATGTNESKAFVPCGAKQGEAGGFFGPELGIAETLHQERPEELFFLIKYAWGGSSLCGNWLSPSSFGKTGNLYKAFVKYVQTSMEYLIAKGYDVAIEGMCWMQGESDSVVKPIANAYEKSLKKLIKDLRKKFSRYAADDGIAFIDAYIADVPDLWKHYDIINAAKQAVADSSPMNVVIDTIAAGLTTRNEPEEAPDLAHYDALSELKLGHLFANRLLPFLE